MPPETIGCRESLVERCDQLSLLPMSIQKLCQLGSIVLVGDSNACVGNLCDTKWMRDVDGCEQESVGDELVAVDFPAPDVNEYDHVRLSMVICFLLCCQCLVGTYGP